MEIRRGRAALRRRKQSWSLVGLSILTLFLHDSAAVANPFGGAVVAGSANISAGGHSVTITQGTDRAIINWQGFSIAPGEVTQFIQPGSHSAILNRVTGGDPSALLGQMQSNGQIFLINPNGILIGPNAQINVGGLTASTLDISNQQFMQGGDLVFSGNSTASVVNFGTVRALEGNIFLIGSSVQNHGLLQAKNGTVGLAAGQTVKLIDSARPHLVVTATSGSLSNVGVLNTGTIDALSAELAANGGNVYALAINNTGVVRATGSVTRNGRVLLTAPGGTIANSGDLIAKNSDGSGGQVKIDASSVADAASVGTQGVANVSGRIDVSGVTGGSVQILGDVVALTGATIDASGAYGGGTVYIGGGLGGSDPAVANAQRSSLDLATTVNTSSSLGEGGQVVVWGTDEVNFHGAIDTLGGDGGFVEVSTKGAGVIDGTALTGYMLVDPQDVAVDSNASSVAGDPRLVTPAIINVNTINGVLSGGGTFTINTTNADVDGDGNADGGVVGGTGRVLFANLNINVNNSTGNMGTFRIEAADTIDTGQAGFLSSGNTGTNYEFYAGTNLGGTPQATADVIHFGQPFNTGGGHVIFDAANDVSIGDPLTTSGGDVTLIARGGGGDATTIFRTNDARIDSGGGTITIQTDVLQIDASATFDPLIDAGTGTVALLPTTAGRAIDLGTVDAESLSITDVNIDRIAADVLRFGSAVSGNIAISTTISPAQATNLSLITGGGIVDGNASGTDVTVTGLALQSAGGVGGLETAVSDLAFSNTGGAVEISNSGALTIGPVDGITASSNTGTTTTITTGSPITFAANIASAGNLTATSGDSGPANTDNVTVNAGVTVQSTGGNVTLQAGDDVILGSGATVSANGALTLNAGHNDVDGDGGITTSPTVTLAGSPVNLNAINDINLGLLSAAGSTVNVNSTGGNVSLEDTSGTYQFANLDVTGNAIHLGATISTSGTQIYNSPMVLTGNTVLSSTGSGDITFNSTINGLFGLTVNTGGTTAFNGLIGVGGDRLGSLTTDAGGATAFNVVSVPSSDPNIDIQNDAFFGDNVTIAGGNQDWFLRGNTTFNGTINSATDMIMVLGGTVAFNGSVTFGVLQITGGHTVINGGSVTTTANLMGFHNDVVLGANTILTSQQGIQFARTLDSEGGTAFALTLNAAGTTRFDGVVGGITPLAGITTDAAGSSLLNGGAFTLSGNTLTFNDPVMLGVDTLITDAGAVTFNNTVDGAFALDINAGGDVTFGGVVGGVAPLATLGVSSGSQILVNAAITTDNGAIRFAADEMAIAADMNAGTGIVTLAPNTAGRTISLGAETAGSLSLTDAELDQITADILRIGSANAGSIDFTDAISLAGTDTLSLITGDQILNTNAGVDVQVANLALQAVNGIGSDSQIDTDVDTVAALNTTSGGIAILEAFNAGDLTVGTVDSVVGIRNEAFTGSAPLLGIQLETNNGDLTVNSDIFLQRRNIFIVAQYRNGQDGDRTFTNNANIINGDSGANANNARIDIRANNMMLNPGSTISAVNRVILEDDPDATSTIAINLGGMDGVNTLGLTNAELNTVTTPGVLQIGHLNGGGSGDITISTAIAPSGVTTLDLETGGGIIDGHIATTADLTVADLVLRTGNGVGVGFDFIETDIDNLAFSNAAGSIALINSGSLTVTALDGLPTSSNSGTTTFLGSFDVLTFAVDASSTGTGLFFASTSIDVANGVVVSSDDMLDFDAPTMNLDGNLTAANGIIGTATTVNILSDTGGAEIQDAVDVARNFAVPAQNVTINIAAGTYAGFEVTNNKPNLTIIGAGSSLAGTVVQTSSPAVTISASGTTIQDMLLTSGGTVDVGILLNGDTANGGTANLTGINIVNVDVTGLTFGVLSTGDIGDGNAATVDVTIRGASHTDRAIFEDLTQAAIAVGDTDGDAVYVIKDLILQDGGDADDLSAGIDGIALGAIGAATIQGVNMTHNAGSDGIYVGPTLTNANILIGGPDADDANTIRGLSDGIDTATLNGGAFVVQGNDLIFGGDDAIDINGQIINGAAFNVIDNTEITGGQDGLNFGAILGGVVTISDNSSITASASDAIAFEGVIGLSSTVSVTDNGNLIGFEDGINVFDLTSGTFTVADNTLIQGQNQNGIELGGFIFGTAQVSVHDNTDILGATSGIEFVEEILGNTTVTIDRNGAATQGGVAYDGTAQVNLASFVPVGRVQGGISFSDISEDAAVIVSRNIISGGGGNGVEFGSISSSQTTAVHNNFILDNAGNGLLFGGDVAGRTEVFQNFIARNGGDGVQVGRAANVGSGNLLVVQNFLPGGSADFANGGFGFNQLGTGTPNIEGNWFGPIANLGSSLNGVAVPSTFVIGIDTNVSTGLGETGLDPFGFQGQFTFAAFPGLSDAFMTFQQQTAYDRFIRYHDFALSVFDMFPGGGYSAEFGPAPQRPLGELAGDSSP